MDRYERAACELMRALRGKRSQRALSRRLRYRGNPVTDWENGRHFPTAADALKCAESCQRPVPHAFERFHTLGVPPKRDGRWHVAPWLDRLRGSMSQVELARRCQCSRFSVRRWLTGAAEPKLPDFLRMMDAITGRAHDWVAALVPIETVPSLEVSYRQTAVAKGLAVEHPWTEAVLRLLELQSASAPGSVEAMIAKALALPEPEVSTLLGLLLEAGIIQRGATSYAVVGTLSVDTRVNPEVFSRLQAFWTGIAQRRLLESHAGPLEWHAYNHISVSHDDLERVRERLKQAFADIRAIVAASEPVDEAALVVLHLIHWDTAEQRAQ